MVETDGPYGGQPCASETHAHHVDNLDSIFWQTKLQGQFYSDLRTLNVFINQPDGYFYQGGCMSGMGQVIANEMFKLFTGQNLMTNH